MDRVQLTAFCHWQANGFVVLLVPNSSNLKKKNNILYIGQTRAFTALADDNYYTAHNARAIYPFNNIHIILYVLFFKSINSKYNFFFYYYCYIIIYKREREE